MYECSLTRNSNAQIVSLAKTLKKKSLAGGIFLVNRHVGGIYGSENSLNEYMPYIFLLQGAPNM